MEPVRVKIYGLFSRTRKRYLLDATIGLAALVFVFIAWFPVWPVLHDRIETGRQNLGWPDLPAWLKITVAVLDVLPWLLAATALYKCLEVYFVLERFTRREAERPPTAPNAASGERQKDKG